jgi:hypothetical protein
MAEPSRDALPTAAISGPANTPEPAALPTTTNPGPTSTESDPAVVIVENRGPAISSNTGATNSVGAPPTLPASGAPGSRPATSLPVTQTQAFVPSPSPVNAPNDLTSNRRLGDALTGQDHLGGSLYGDDAFAADIGGPHELRQFPAGTQQFYPYGPVASGFPQYTGFALAAPVPPYYAPLPQPAGYAGHWPNGPWGIPQFTPPFHPPYPQPAYDGRPVGVPMMEPPYGLSPYDTNAMAPWHQAVPLPSYTQLPGPDHTFRRPQGQAQHTGHTDHRGSETDGYADALTARAPPRRRGAPADTPARTTPSATSDHPWDREWTPADIATYLQTFKVLNLQEARFRKLESTVGDAPASTTASAIDLDSLLGTSSYLDLLHEQAGVVGLINALVNARGEVDHAAFSPVAEAGTVDVSLALAPALINHLARIGGIFWREIYEKNIRRFGSGSTYVPVVSGSGATMNPWKHYFAQLERAQRLHDAAFSVPPDIALEDLFRPMALPAKDAPLESFPHQNFKPYRAFLGLVQMSVMMPPGRERLVREREVAAVKRRIMDSFEAWYNERVNGGSNLANWKRIRASTHADKPSAPRAISFAQDAAVSTLSESVKSMVSELQKQRAASASSRPPTPTRGTDSASAAGRTPDKRRPSTAASAKRQTKSAFFGGGTSAANKRQQRPDSRNRCAARGCDNLTRQGLRFCGACKPIDRKY